MISLSQVLSLLSLPCPTSFEKEIFFEKLVSDTRRWSPQDLFIAVPGENFSTDALIQTAIASGIRYIVAEKSHIPCDDAFIIPVEDIHHSKHRLSLLFYPKQPKFRVAVTGTSGKTSTVSFLKQLWEMAELPAATVGTLGIQSTYPLPISYDFEPLTTPHATMFYEILDACVQANIQHLAFEATSHALAQKRLGPFKAEIGIFTNLSRDHLDYHQTMEAYADAKKRLFLQHMQEGDTAILHEELPFLDALKEECQQRGLFVIVYGKNQKEAGYVVESCDQQEQKVCFHVLGKTWKKRIPLIGAFQIDNLLAALAAFSVLKKDPSLLPLENIQPVPGRLEYAGKTASGGRVYVDFSHKPGALEKALLQLRPFTEKKLGVVFGCGGQRDQGKRKMMGEIAARLSDWIIITDDNPRYEDAAEIRHHILEGCPGAEESSPREVALKIAIERLKEGDILLVAGKGNETSQVIGDHKMEFCDKTWIRKLIDSSEPVDD